MKVRMRNLLHWSAVALLGVLPVGAIAQSLSWSTVELAGDWGSSITTDGNGNVFAGGSDDPSGSLYGYPELVLDTTPSVGPSWYVSDDSPNPLGGATAYVTGLAFDSYGNLWSVGNLLEPSASGDSWYVRMSPNPISGTASWTTEDTYQYDVAGEANSVAADNSGNLYIAGDGLDANGVEHWLVRKFSPNANPSWASVEDLPSGIARGIAFVPKNSYLPNGALFVVGDGPVSSRKGHKTTTEWLVQRSVDGGSTWVNVNVGAGDVPWAVASDSNGYIYVAGNKGVQEQGSGRFKSSYINEWFVIESKDGGATWSTADEFTSKNYGADAYGIGMDYAGNPVVVGTATESDGTGSHWIVRRPINGGWTTVDDYQLASGEHSAALGATSDNSGNLLVTGYAVDGSGVSHWIVRSTPQ